MDARDAARRGAAHSGPGAGVAWRWARIEGCDALQCAVPGTGSGVHRRALLRAPRAGRCHLAPLRAVCAYLPAAAACQPDLWAGARPNSDHAARWAGAEGSVSLVQAARAFTAALFLAGLDAHVAGEQT